MLLGEYLIAKKIITHAVLGSALEEQKRTGEFLGNILLRRKLVTEEELARALADQFGMGFVKLKNEAVDWNVATRFSAQLVVEHKCFPYREDARGLVIALSNPLDVSAIQMAEAESGGRNVRVMLAVPREIDEMVKQFKDRLADKIRRMLT